MKRTAITRERLDALEVDCRSADEAYDRDDIIGVLALSTDDVRGLIAALRHVLDLRPDHKHRGASWGDGNVEYVSWSKVRAALAGTQTDDGAICSHPLSQLTNGTATCASCGGEWTP